MSRTKTTESVPEKAVIPVSLKSEAAAEWVPTGSLVPNPKNAELRDNADAIPLVAESIRRFLRVR